MKFEIIRIFILRNTSTAKRDSKQILDYSFSVSIKIQFPLHRKFISSQFPV